MATMSMYVRGGEGGVAWLNSFETEYQEFGQFTRCVYVYKIYTSNFHLQNPSTK